MISYDDSEFKEYKELKNKSNKTWKQIFELGLKQL